MRRRVTISTHLQVLYGIYNIIMHECSSHIKHKDKAGGLFVVKHECIIPYSIRRGVLTHTVEIHSLISSFPNLFKCGV